MTGAVFGAERLYVNDKKVPESQEDLLAIQFALQSSLDQVRKATICIKIDKGSGTGVIVSEDGLVLTAAHVVTGVQKKMNILLEDGSEYEAQSLGLNSENDAAMLQILSDKKFPFVEYQVENIKHESMNRVGDWVFALGHSGGFDRDRGSVVRLGRLVRTSKNTVQSDCKLIGGDSGGPLFDMNGVLIAIHSRVGKRLGQNMHVPLQVFHEHWELLSNGEFIGNGPFAKRVQKGTGFMGLAVELVEGGLKVVELDSGYAAAESGVLLGDILLSINKQSLESKKALKQQMKQLAIGDKVDLELLRDGERLRVSFNFDRR